jgi:hypothetical protein
MICRDCKEEFSPRPNKPGFINQCESCATDVPLLGGNMIWDHKTAPYIEIKSMVKAKSFAAMTKRFGVGVTQCLTQSKERDNKELGRA